MARPPTTSPPQDEAVRVLDRGFWLVVAAACVMVVAMIARVVLGPGGDEPGAVVSPTASASAAPSATASELASYLYSTPREAPPLELTDQDSRRFSLAAQRGAPVLVFFGYTHCPDICPATTGAVGMAMDGYGPGVSAVFVTIDPERDTTTWLKEYVRFLPTGFVALTGTDGEIRAAAEAWDVRYARVETGVADAYSMAHTADVYLVDSEGLLRAHFAFGTAAETMTAVLREVVASPLAVGESAAPSTVTPAAPSVSVAPGASSIPVESVAVDVVSTSVWAGPPGPVILDLLAGGVRVDVPGLAATVQLTRPSGEPVGSPAIATPVQPPGLDTVSYVAELAIPEPGDWRIEVRATRDGAVLAGTASLRALDPGATAAIGAPAPAAHTPTLDDVGGVVRAVTTDPAPELRLSQRSTTDALAAGQPFVLVIDSNRFRVSPACGRAIIMARYMVDRWRDVGFIHLEPYRYSVVADTPVLDGSLTDPILTDPASAWGIGGDPWGPASMPWVFVVDGDGVVRAKYQGVMGSVDVDVILALVAQGG
jgi:protein SCO1/2